RITRVTSPTFDVADVIVSATALLLRKPSGAPAGAYVVVASREGPGPIRDPGPVPDGVFDYAARQAASDTDVSPITAPVSVTIAPTTPALAHVALVASDDTGVRGAGLTAVRRPRLAGTTEPGASLQWIDASGTPLASATAATADGSFTIQPSANLPIGA